MRPMMKVLLNQGVFGTDLYTKLMLHGDGNLTDSSVAPKTVTAPSGISYTTGKFNQCINTATSKYLSVADHPDFVLGTSEWTFDVYVYRASTDVSKYPYIFSRCVAGASAAGAGYRLFINDTSRTRFVLNNSDGTAILIDSSAAFPFSQWVHLAVERDNTNNVIRLYQNGVVVGTTAIDSATSVYNSNTAFIIGSGNYSGGFSYYWNGYIDEFRFSSGIARYRGNFTPPASPYIA